MLRPATVSGVVEPRHFSPAANFGSGGAARRLVEVDRSYIDEDVIWQQAVYVFARQIADNLGLTQIADIGAGSGIKLYTEFSGYRGNLLQVDWRDQRRSPPQEASPVPFLQANLEDYFDVELLEARLDPTETVLLILADVIEHLIDPRPLLRTLRRVLRRHPDNRLIISTPDRHRIGGRGSERLPDNPGHVREWTLDEFGLAMMAAGFQIRQVGYVPQNQYDDLDRTCVAELSCSSEHYRTWLSNHGLPPSSDHMVLTTEHARATRTGGIGSYLQQAEDIKEARRVVLYAGAIGLPETGWSEDTRAKNWIHVSDLCGRSDRPLNEIAFPDPEEILRATVQAVFLYDEVRLVEYQDFLGIGVRVAQAKRAGLIPPSVVLLAYAHGNHLYLDAAGDVVEGYRSLRIDAWERLSLELADCAAFPSGYIRRLYLEQGGFRPRAERHLPYPIRIAQRGLDELSRGPITNLVFYGKQTRQKGYPDFIEAVLSLFREAAYADAAEQITRVALLGVTDPDPRLNDLPVEVEHGVWSLDEVLAMLRHFAPDSLLVLPYHGDNHPLSVLEVIDADCQLLAFEAGGIPELLPAQLHSLLLCQPNARALASGMARAIRLAHWDRCQLVKETRNFVGSERHALTIAYQNTMAELKGRRQPDARPTGPGAITVVVTNLNGSRRHLEDVALGIRNSLHQPMRVLLVDDGSTPENLHVLIDVANHAFGKIPTEVLCNAVNLGLAGARNVGLAQVKTPYLCTHDNDDIVLNHFFRIACRTLDENPGVAAVTSYSRYFKDGRYWQKEEDRGFGYRPVGADLGLALRSNVIGAALAVYRVEALQSIGGWDQSTKAKWEDWQLHCRLVASGYDVWVIPQEMFMYRIRADSMLRTYPDFPGWLRLSTALPGLPRAQAVSTLRTLWRLSKWEGDELVPVAVPGSVPIRDKGGKHRKRKKFKRALSKPFRSIKRRIRIVWKRARGRLKTRP